MRHAKSSWDYPALDDYDRPLNKRGERDATRMASWLSQQSDLPEKIITSGAKRAHELAKQVQQAISGPLVINDEIYGASARALLKLVRSCDDELERIMIVGHNPELTTFINKYGNMDLENFEDLPLRQEITEEILVEVVKDYKAEITAETPTTTVED